MSRPVPRDVSGADLVRGLTRRGYAVVRQTGSHVRLTWREGADEHHITVPLHDPVKVGTLSAILAAVADALGVSRDELIDDL